MAKYNLYHGDFRCHVCKADVKTLRLYAETKELSWMCPERHVSTVDLNTKRNKKDFTDES
jgi:hypothetical protein